MSTETHMWPFFDSVFHPRFIRGALRTPRANEYRPIAEIVEELEAIEEEATKTDSALKEVLRKLVTA